MPVSTYHRVAEVDYSGIGGPDSLYCHSNRAKQLSFGCPSSQDVRVLAQEPLRVESVNERGQVPATEN